MNIPFKLLQMRMDRLLELLGETEVFSSLENAELVQLARSMEFREFAPGKVLVQQHEMGEEFFILVEGSAQVVMQSELLRTERHVLTLQAGQSFGETSLLTREPRTATVKALEKTVCAVLNRENFQNLFEQVPSVSRTMARYLAQRLTAQCRLDGPAFVSLNQFPYQPELFRMVPLELLKRCRGVPVQLNGRLLTIAMVQPDNFSLIRLLQEELVGFRLQCAACSADDYLSYMAQHETASGRTVSFVESHDPLPSVVRLLTNLPSGTLVLDPGAETQKVYLQKGGRLSPLLPSPSDQFLRQLESTLTSFFLTHQAVENVVRSIRVDGQSYLLQVSRFEHRSGFRYSLRLSETRIQPLKHFFPAGEMRAAVREVLASPHSFLLIDGSQRNVAEAVHKSILGELVEDLGAQGVLYLGDLLESQQVPCTLAVHDPKLAPYLETAFHQGITVAAHQGIGRKQWKELIRFQGQLPSVLAVWKEGPLIPALDYLIKEVAAGDSLLYGFHLLTHKMVRQACPYCRQPYKPSEKVGAELGCRGLDNEDALYFRSGGCEHCLQSGHLGSLPLFSLSRVEVLVEGGSVRRTVWSYAAHLRGLLKSGRVDPEEALRVVPMR